MWHITKDNAQHALQKAASLPFIKLMEHGTMSVEYYVPVLIDKQTPHRQDELYIIAKGSGTFYRNGEKVSVIEGDVLFVPAGMEHRFIDFTNDFATWVIFYGDDGGEKINAV